MYKGTLIRMSPILLGLLLFPVGVALCLIQLLINIPIYGYRAIRSVLLAGGLHV